MADDKSLIGTAIDNAASGVSGAVGNVIDKGKNAASDTVSSVKNTLYINTVGQVGGAITKIGNETAGAINSVGNSLDNIVAKPSLLDQTTRPEFDESTAGLLKYVKANGLGIGPGRVSQTEKYQKFARYERLDPNNWMGSTREFIFFTTPDLQLFKGPVLNPSIANNALMVEAFKRYNDVLQSLSYSACGRPFVNLLSNYKRSNVDLPDINTASDYETSKNILGSSLFYRGTSYESDENHEFSVEFEDTKYLEVYMWFRLFDEYERMKHYGLVDFVDDNYLNGKIIHDQMAMYKFIVGEDGESIIHYSKFIGVYPKNVPRSTFSDLPADGNVKFTINFKASYVEDMDPNIILDFNEVAKKIPAGDPKLGGFMDEFNGWSGEFMQRPYIALPPTMLYQGGTAGNAVNSTAGTSGDAQNRMVGGIGGQAPKNIIGRAKGAINSAYDTVSNVSNNLETAYNETQKAKASVPTSKFTYFQDPKYELNYGYNETLPNKGFYKLKWEG